MELHELKSVWKATQTPAVPTADLQHMLSENKHPVLKSIRKQITIEMVAWCIFLLCYYTMFDGDRKPSWINALLVLSVLLPLGHNVLGYRLAKHIVYENNLYDSLKKRLVKVRVYVILSIISRQVYLAGLLLFFTYGISFNNEKYIPAVMISLFFILQLWMSISMWNKRLRKLRDTIASFG